MEIITLLSLSLVFLICLILTGWFFSRHLRTLVQRNQQDQSFLIIQQQIDQLRVHLGQVLESRTQGMQQQLGQWLGHVHERLKENSDALQVTQQSLGERLDHAAAVVGNVQRSLGGLEEANRKIYEIGRDIASLQEILRAPKLRGELGEFFLEDLLTQLLPQEHFAMQYGFRSGEKVDAVIKLGGSLVPVDSKFPLENFKRMLEALSDDERNRAKRQFTADVKKHIDSIAAKYILPDEGTYDFSLMYIPAENVYYETIIRDDSSADNSLIHYAFGKKVIPVSPNSFYIYLQAIVLGLKGLKIEDRAKEIWQHLSRLQGDFSRIRDDFGLVGKHLGHAHASYQSAENRIEQFGQKLSIAASGKLEPAESRSSRYSPG